MILRGQRRLRQRRRRRLWLGLGLLIVGAFVLAGLVRPQWFLDAEYARMRWLAGASESSVEMADHRWSQLTAGSGQTVVLVHGFTGSKENWLPAIGALAESARVIAPDLPGWGRSERKPNADYGLVAQADRLAQFLAELPVGDKRPVLVGHSMGGAIAALVAADHPELLDRLVLVDAAGTRFNDNDFSRAVATGEHPFEVTDRASLDRQLALVFNDPPWIPWPADRALIAQRRADLDFEIRVLDQIGRSVDAERPIQRAPTIQIPTLLLWCRDDRIIDVDAATRYAAVLPDSRTVLLEGCNHMPMMERPDATARAIGEFLEG